MHNDPYRSPQPFEELHVSERPTPNHWLSEILLASGLLCTAFATALMHFVMIGLLGMLLLMVATGLLLVAGLAVGSESQKPWWQRIASYLLYVVGAIGVMVIALNATMWSYANAVPSRNSAANGLGWQWMVLAAISVLLSSMLTAALAFRSEWPRSRCIAWGIAAFAVAPLATLLFWTMKWAGLPLTA